MAESYPRYSGEDILAYCQGCGGELRNFERVYAQFEEYPQPLPNPPRDGFYVYSSTIVHELYRCRACKSGAYCKAAKVTKRSALGGLATFVTSALVDFYPRSISLETLPTSVPAPIACAVQEGSRCEQEGLFRAAGAIYRAALEQLFKVNGYDKESTLFKRIEAAHNDKLITLHLRKRADALREAGNDILHDFDVVDKSRVVELRRFLHSLVSEFYEHRTSVEEELRKAKRI